MQFRICSSMKKIDDRMPLLPADGIEHARKKGPHSQKHLVRMTELVSENVLLFWDVPCRDRSQTALPK